MVGWLIMSISHCAQCKSIPAVGELKAQKMKLELNFDNSTNAESSTSAPIAGYAVP